LFNPDARACSQSPARVSHTPISTALVNQTRKTDPAMSVAAVTFDFKQVQLADKLA
jgi:hypothetical protein